MSAVSTIWATALESVLDVVADGMTIAVGGFGVSGVPVGLIEAVRDSGATGLTIVSNNMGIEGTGLSLLLENDQVAKVVASYIGENKLFARRFLAGEVEVEFVPQGTLAERLRAGGAGIPAFYTKTGVGTEVAAGKPVEIFDGESFIRERAIVADVSLVRAHLGDGAGNLTYRYTARNFNPVVATAGHVTIAEVERIVDVGEIDPNHVITPGVYVQRMVLAPDREKDIEQRTVRQRPLGADAAGREMQEA